SFTLTASSPAGTAGKVSIPTFGAKRVIARDGKVVWDGEKALSGSASTDGDYVTFDLVGANTSTFAWAAGDQAGPAQPPVVTKASPTVSFKLSSSAVRAGKRVTATVKVTAPGKLQETGTFAIKDGSKTVKTVTLRAADKGRRTVTVPKLRKGKHTLKVVYSGNATINRKTSVTRTLRVR
ncbi:MAG: Ig-like domain-containing protein, partial [Aeromicrobium sp.]